jgi:hypothetical protein
VPELNRTEQNNLYRLLLVAMVERRVKYGASLEQFLRLFWWLYSILNSLQNHVTDTRLVKLQFIVTA